MAAISSREMISPRCHPRLQLREVPHLERHLEIQRRGRFRLAQGVAHDPGRVRSGRRSLGRRGNRHDALGTPDAQPLGRLRRQGRVQQQQCHQGQTPASAAVPRPPLRREPAGDPTRRRGAVVQSGEHFAHHRRRVLESQSAGGASILTAAPGKDSIDFGAVRKPAVVFAKDSPRAVRPDYGAAFWRISRPNGGGGPSSALATSASVRL